VVDSARADGRTADGWSSESAHNGIVYVGWQQVGVGRRD
jgi:hypothetical protein